MTARRLDTSELGPIHMPPPAPEIVREARGRFADALVAVGGPAYARSADSIRSGGYANVWIAAGLAAIEKALREGPADE